MKKERNGAESVLNVVTLIILGTSLLIVSISLIWEFYTVRQQTRQVVLNVGNAYLNRDLASKLWGTSHGGVYVPVSDTSQPNPYLAHIPERDIETPSGKKLTLMNPAYMLRTMMLQFSQLTGTSGNLTSIDTRNPINEPDEWERSVLDSFRKGVPEAFAFTNYKGEPHLRLMRPFITQEPCLKCHAVQGYKIGDIRGGTSISIPLKPYQEISEATMRTILITHLTLFFLAVLVIFWGSKKIRKHIRRDLAMQEGIHSQLEFTKSIINSLSHPFLVVDANGYNIVMANDAARKKNNLLVKTCYQLTYNKLQPCMEPGLQCPLRIIKESKKAVTVEHIHYDDLGTPVEVEVQGFPIFDDSGEVMQVILYSYDISDRKKAEREKMMLQEQLQQAQKLEAIGTIAGGIAHDFNNILGGILGFAQLAKMTIPKDDNSWDYVDQISKAGHRASDLVKQILTFSRRTTHETIPQPVQAIVKEAVNLLKISTPKNIKVEMNIDENCGPVHLDPTQVHQVVMNLCTNAFQAMEKEGGTLEVFLNQVEVDEIKTIAGQKLVVGSYLLLVVRDSGKGIDAETMKNMFTPFYTTKDIGCGTGLGLSMVQRIVQTANGVISVESTPDKGTTFSVYFRCSQRDSG